MLCTNRPDILIEVCPYVFTRCHTLKDEQAVWNNLYNLKYNIYIYFHEIIFRWILNGMKKLN